MGVDRVIDITDEEREIVLDLLQWRLPGVEAWVYGSRAKWMSRPQSDLDLVVFSTPEQSRRVEDLREAFEESNLPFRVDLFVWSEVPEQFHQEIERDHVVLVSKGECNHSKLKTKRGWPFYSIFPAHWRPRPLYSMATWTNGIAFKNIQFAETGRPVIKISEIKGGISGQTKFTQQTFNESVLVRPGDLLFSWLGQPETSIDIFWWRGPEGWLNQHIFKVTPHAGLDTTFFYYLLRYLKPNFVGISRNKQTTGLGHVTKRDLENLEVSFPDLTEQHAIAHILGTLDDKIELNRRMNETLEAMAHALFKSWFIDFGPVRAKAVLKQHATDHSPHEGESAKQGRQPTGAPVGGNALTSNYQVAETDAPPPYQPSPDGASSTTPPQGGSNWTVERARAYLDRMDPIIADLFPDRLVVSDIGEIPAGWKAGPLRDLIDFNPKRPLRKGDVAPYLDMANMPTTGHVPDKWFDRSFGTGMRFTNGDTLLARITPCLENGKTAYIDFLLGDSIGWGSTEYIVMRPKPPLPNEFAYCLARSAGFREYAIHNMIGTSGRQRVPATALSYFHLAVPMKDVADSFGELVGPLFAQASTNADASRTLTSLRDTLLPKLISGQIRLRETEKTVEAIA